MLPLSMYYKVYFLFAISSESWNDKELPSSSFDIKLERQKMKSLCTKADTKFRSNVFVEKGKRFEMLQAENRSPGV